METFFSKNASLEFIPCDFIKNKLHHRDYLAWVLQGTFFNILENSLRGDTVISFIQEVITLLKGLGLVSRTRHLQLCNRQCLYLNTDADAIANAEMPMPRFQNGLLSIYRGPLTFSSFQMAASKPSRIRPSFLRFLPWLKF